MTPEPIPVRPASVLECRNCGAGAPRDEHFCPQCSRILALGRHGDYFAFFGIPHRLTIDLPDLERRFRELSRKFHPDFFYNATPAERLASLERSSYLNDAYRVLRNPAARVEYLLSVEGLPPARSEQGTAHVPPALLEDVFTLNEELDEIRESREEGTDPGALRARLAEASTPIVARRQAHEQQMADLIARWDRSEAAAPEARRTILEALREQLLERNYINNLFAAIDREAASLKEAGAAAEGHTS